MSQNVVTVTHKVLSELLPNGMVQCHKLTEQESIAINSSIDKSNKHNIKAANKVMIICIKGKCRERLNLYKPTVMKASNWRSKHLINCHEGEEIGKLDEEVLVHSFWTTSGAGKHKQYKDHYLLINITGTKTFQYIKQQSFHAMFMNNKNNTEKYYPEIDLRTSKSSKCMSILSIYVHPCTQIYVFINIINI